ncbi:unnamed protein product [Lota lota]
MHPAPRILGFICLCIRATGGDGSSWTANIPGSITALNGSCVVIPCSFDYPQFVPKASTEFTGIWFDQTKQIVYHPNSTKMMKTYQGRVTLLGTISRKNCTMMIDPVRESDIGPFHFRIEITDYDKFSYKEHSVSVTVKPTPEPISMEVDKDLKEGEFGVASCSVVLSCPAAPPTFTWTHSGYHTSQLLPHENGQWQARSTLGFPLTRNLHNTSLGCMVDYKGGEKSKSSQVLLVKHAPLNVTLQQLWVVQEGQPAELRCLSDGYPTVHRYWWFSEREQLLQMGQNYLRPNVSRHADRLYCRATNTEGRAQSDLVQLNATYPPEVSPASACSTFTLRVSCECVVEANPPAVVHLSQPSGVPLSTVLETQGSVTVATLVGDGAALWSSDPIFCHATNNLGNTTHTLQVPGNGKVLIFTGIATVVLLLIVMIPLGVKWKRKQIQDNETLGGTHINEQINWKEMNNSYKDADAVYGNV